MLRALALGFLLLPLGACSTAGVLGDAPRVANVNHVVLFSLVDPAKAPELLADGDKHLPAIPGVTAYSSGTHIDIGRDGISDAYDAAFYIGFDTVEAYRSYLGHPLHQDLVQRWSDQIEDAVIYDFGTE